MLKKLLLSTLFLAAAVVPAAGKDLKVLMIGNSFSICVGIYLPSVVKSVPGNRLELTSAYIGGCTLEKHCKNLEKAENKPDFKPYRINVWSSDSPAKALKNYKGNVNELLKKNQYDVVTIQQGSRQSWDYKYYQPYADQLVAYIRKHQPEAEIVIQQTWAYRCDHPNLKPNPKARWDFDQAGMYERVRDSYRKLAEAHHFRVIPMGDAVQLFRKYTPVKFQPAAEDEFKYPAVPSSAGDVVGQASWRKNAKSGEMQLKYDQFHLNATGHYLQACLWFAALYGEPVSKIQFAPKSMKPELKTLLHKCAQEALDQYVQAK